MLWEQRSRLQRVNGFFGGSCRDWGCQDLGMQGTGVGAHKIVTPPLKKIVACRVQFAVRVTGARVPGCLSEHVFPADFRANSPIKLCGLWVIPTLDPKLPKRHM